MAPLWEIAKLIRSKNAGPWQLTIDIMFETDELYQRACRSDLAKPGTYADIYNIEPADIRLFLHDVSLAIKVTFPRPTAAGAVNETDVFGGQFHSPLVNFDVSDN